jgi:hypothetical protein
VTSRIFLLSPAHCGGRRAVGLLSAAATSPLSARLRSPEGAPLGDVFAYVSGLYFRGKLVYARRFAAPPEADPGVIGAGIHVITPSAGLRSPDSLVTAAMLRDFARADVHPDNPAYRVPFDRTASAVARALEGRGEVVLLGSVASSKYIDVLRAIFGSQLRFPIAFVGRGDMSRGGLMLRSAAAGVELEYAPIDGTSRRGPRPPKLPPLRRGA